ncbi:MAG: hypothetical protein AABX40_08485 [Candidatus Hydrothermarchaeota archaeon]
MWGRGWPRIDPGVIEELARRSEGYTGADIASICNEAVMLAIREFVKGGDERDLKALRLEMRHFKGAMAKHKPLSREELRRYTEAAERFGRAARGEA